MSTARGPAATSIAGRIAPSMTCSATLDGEHHWARRSHRIGEWPHWTYTDRWECVCTATPPARLIPKLEKLEAKAERIKSARFGQEEHEEPRMDL